MDLDLAKVVGGLGAWASKRKVSGLGVPTLAESYSVADVPAWIPSGISALDRALGGGLPIGRMSEVYSQRESEGKTTLLLHFAAQCQRAGGVVVWVESEAALDRLRAARLGLDLSRTMLWSPGSVEQGFDYLREAVSLIRAQDENCPILVVWDTIAAAPIESVKESGDPYSGGIAEKPRVISRTLQSLVSEIAASRYHLCLINQVYTTFSRFGSSYETPGGKGIKFYASTRIELKRVTSLTTGTGSDKVVQGLKVAIKAVKNKLALPHRTVECALFGETGFDNARTLAWLYEARGFTDLLAPAKPRWRICGADKTVFESGISDYLAEHPQYLYQWQQGLDRVWPLQDGRKIHPVTGWVVS